MSFKPFDQLRGILGRNSGALVREFPLCAYGKLHLYKDYINLACNDGAAADFKRWIDQAFGATYEAFGGRAVEPDGPRRLLWPLEQERHWAIACVWPSADAGGLRKFPFSFFAPLPRRALTGAFESDWPLLQSLWMSLEQHYDDATHLQSIDEFYNHFKSGLVRADAQDARPGAEPPTLREWFEALDPQQPAACAQGLTEAVTELIAGCKSAGSAAHDLAVRVPLAPGCEIASQVELWLRVFRGHLKCCQPPPGMILPAGMPRVGANACLLWRNGRVEDARLFAEPLADYDYIENLCPPFGADQRTEPAADDLNNAYQSTVGQPSTIGQKSPPPSAANASPLGDLIDEQFAPVPEPKFDLDQSWDTWIASLA